MLKFRNIVPRVAVCFFEVINTTQQLAEIIVIWSWYFIYINAVTFAVSQDIFLLQVKK